MAKGLPNSDAFAYGSPVYGSFLKGYIRTRFWTGADTVTGYGVQWTTDGDLFDGYSDSLAGGIPQFGTSSMSAACTGDATDPDGWIFRNYLTAAAVEVQAEFQSKPVAGSGFDNDDLWQSGFIGLRLTGGTNAVTGSDSRLENIASGYLFGLVNTKAAGSRYFLLRLNGTATPTVVASTAATALTNNAILRFPHTLMLSATDSGADVQLLARVKNPPVFTKFQTTPQTQTIFDVTDAGGFQGSGRCGFGLSARRTATGNPGGAYVPVCNNFRVLQTGSLKVNDTFRRTVRLQARAVTDAGGKTGRDLASAFTADEHGLATYRNKLEPSSATLGEHLRADPANSTLGVTTDEHTGGYFISQRRPDSERSQHRQVLFYFNAAGAAIAPHRSGGVVLRATGGTSSDTSRPDRGYLAEIIPADAAPATTTARIRLWRFDGPNKKTLLGERLDAALTTGTLLGLRVEIYNATGLDGDPDGQVAIQIRRNGVIQVLDTNIAPDIQVDAGTGIVTDRTSERVVSGLGEGFRVYLPGGTNTTDVDTWLQLPFTNAISVPENDQGTIAIGNELTKFDAVTWTTPLSWPVREDAGGFSTIEYRYEDGGRTVVGDQPIERRSWIVEARANSDAERIALFAFYDAREGVERGFNWQPPQETTVAKVHFADDAIGQAMLAPDVNSFTFRIEELIS